MKMNLTKAVGMVAAVVVLATGCKKDDIPAKEYRVTKIFEAAIEYNSAGNPVLLGNIDGATSLFYSGGKVVARLAASSGSANRVDSLFYDAGGKHIRTVQYESQGGLLVKTKTTTLAYNNDGRINTLTVDYVDPLTYDQLVEHTYSGGNLLMRTKSEYVNSTYMNSFVEEYLAYDDKKNVLYDLYKQCFMDQGEALHIMACGPNNVTSFKRTNYNITTGNITAVETISFSHVYNENNIATRYQLDQGGSTYIVDIAYEEK